MYNRYFSVYLMDKGLTLAHGIAVPPGLDLMLFSAGATTPGVRNVVVPLLKKVRWPDRSPVAAKQRASAWVELVGCM